MKKIKTKRIYYLLVCFTLILFSCNINKEKFIIEEIKASSNDTVVTENKYSFKSHGSHFSFFSSTNSDLEDVSISFSNKRLSAILNNFEYPYDTNAFENNTILNIEYYKGNTTKEKAVKEIIDRLKETYNF